MISDPIGDMLTRIRNGFLASQRQIVVPHSKIKENLAQILTKNGYLKKIEVEGKDKKNLNLTLRYEGKKPAIVQIKRVSKPGRRVYIKSKQIKPVLSGLGIMVISTPTGMMTGKQAFKENLGGEVICQVW